MSLNPETSGHLLRKHIVGDFYREASDIEVPMGDVLFDEGHFFGIEGLLTRLPQLLGYPGFNVYRVGTKEKFQYYASVPIEAFTKILNRPAQLMDQFTDSVREAVAALLLLKVQFNHLYPPKDILNIVEDGIEPNMKPEVIKRMKDFLFMAERYIIAAVPLLSALIEFFPQTRENLDKILTLNDRAQAIMADITQLRDAYEELLKDTEEFGATAENVRIWVQKIDSLHTLLDSMIGK